METAAVEKGSGETEGPGAEDPSVGGAGRGRFARGRSGGSGGRGGYTGAPESIGKADPAIAPAYIRGQDVPLERIGWAKVSFCPDPKSTKGGAPCTPIYERIAPDDLACVSVNAGNFKHLRVGGGTINGQFEKELWDAAWHQTDRYGPFHEGLFRIAADPKSLGGLIEAPPALLKTRPEGLANGFIYLGATPAESQQIGCDSGRAGLVILDMFGKDFRPYHARNVGMIYTVGPDRANESSDEDFLRKVQLVGCNILLACRDYNALQRSIAHAEGTKEDRPPIQRVRLCLVSGGKYAGRVPKEQVARRLAMGVLQGLPGSSDSASDLDATPEIEFAFDGDVFRRQWDALRCQSAADIAGSAGAASTGGGT